MCHLIIVVEAKENAEMKNEIVELKKQLSDKHQEVAGLLKTNEKLKSLPDARNKLEIEIDTIKQSVRIPFDLKKIFENSYLIYLI